MAIVEEGATLINLGKGQGQVLHQEGSECISTPQAYLPDICPEVIKRWTVGMKVSHYCSILICPRIHLFVHYISWVEFGESLVTGFLMLSAGIRHPQRHGHYDLLVSSQES